MNFIFRINIYFLLLVYLCHPFTALAQEKPVQVSKQGVLDLRNTDLSVKPVLLGGEWNFYWETLIAPGDTIPAKHNYILYPQLWKEKKLGGQPLPSQWICQLYALYFIA